MRVRLSFLPAAIGTPIAVACSAAALVVGFAVGAKFVSASRPDRAPGVAHTTAPVPPPLPAVAPPPPTATAASEGGEDRPYPRDFIMSAHITSKKCYGTAGCDYVYMPYPMYMGKQHLPLPAAYTVTYGVRLCDQVCRTNTPPTNPAKYPQVGNFTINPDGLMTYDKQGSISGPDGDDLIVELIVLAVLEDHPARLPRYGVAAVLRVCPFWVHPYLTASFTPAGVKLDLDPQLIDRCLLNP